MRASFHDFATKNETEPCQDLFRDGRLPPMLVRASAGTGKTYRLTGRLLNILLQGAPPETILATTFTRKAAGEILHRVLLTLAKAADPSNESALRELRQQVGLETLPHSACRQLLQKLIRNIHRLRISTLDSLFTQLAKSFPLELQLPASWRLTDEIEEIWLTERAIDSVISMLDPSELTSLLSMLSKGETKRSIARELIQVVGGAYAIARRSAGDVWMGLDAPTRPDDISLAQASVALRQSQPPQKSVRGKLETMADLIDARDFDAIANDRLMSNYAKAKLTGQEIKFGRSTLPDGLDDALGTLYAAARTSILSLLVAQNEATGNILAFYDAQINQLKRASRTLGFDDVAAGLADHFAQLDQSTLNRRMDGAVDHLLLDEFQDTSPVQWHVLRPLAIRAAQPTAQDNASESSGVAKSFFCVGDTKQAIYGWRGGVAQIFDTVDEELPQTKSVEQNQSFRSSPVIMDFVNQVFKNLQRHPMASIDSLSHEADKAFHEATAIQEFSKGFPTHTASKQSLSGYVRIETCPLEAAKSTSEERAQWCYELAAARVRQIFDDSVGSVGVLTRTNKGVANLIYLLDRLGVDASQEGGNPLVDSAAVELVLSVLMMVEHPSDGRWQFHVQNSPLGQIENLDAHSVRGYLTEYGLARTIDRLRSLLVNDCDQRDRTRLRQLAQLAISYEPNASSRLRDFVRLVREKRVERPQVSRVRVMTIHQAKGLEFDAVVLPELDGRLIGKTPFCVTDTPKLSEPPVAISRYLSSSAWHYLDQRWRAAFGRDAGLRMTEVLCTLYVALTRAKQALYLITQPGKPTDRKVSTLIHTALNGPDSIAEPSTVLWEQGDRGWWER